MIFGVGAYSIIQELIPEKFLHSSRQRKDGAAYQVIGLGMFIDMGNTCGPTQLAYPYWLRLPCIVALDELLQAAHLLIQRTRLRRGSLSFRIGMVRNNVSIF